MESMHDAYGLIPDWHVTYVTTEAVTMTPGLLLLTTMQYVTSVTQCSHGPWAHEIRPILNLGYGPLGLDITVC